MAITKCINSESKQFKPVLTDKLVLDAVPTVNSLNGVTSDGVARAIAGASGEVPQVTESDNGKVLTAIYDEGGPAVEWAEASSGGGDVTTADGYFRLGGSKPVKVQYTGTAELTPKSLDVDDHTKCNGTGYSELPQFFVWFDNTNGLTDLGNSYTATLKMKAASLLSYFPAGVTVTYVSQVFYCNNSNWNIPSGPGMAGTLAITDNDIKEQSVTVSGANQAGPGYGYGVYIGFYFTIKNVTDPDTGNYYDLTDALTALIAGIKAGDVFELDWPSPSQDGGMVTTIPNVPAPNNQQGKFLKSVQTGASTWEMQWATINQVPSFSSFNAGKVLTVNQYGNAATWAAPALGSVTSIQQVSALPATPDANTLYLIPEA